MIARKVSASWVALAFLKYTTCTLPGSAVGWSSLAISDLARLSRASDGARTISVLVRESANTTSGVVAPCSISRFTMAAMSVAMV